MSLLGHTRDEAIKTTKYNAVDIMDSQMRTLYRVAARGTYLNLISNFHGSLEVLSALAYQIIKTLRCQELLLGLDTEISDLISKEQFIDQNCYGKEVNKLVAILEYDIKTLFQMTGYMIYDKNWIDCNGDNEDRSRRNHLKFEMTAIKVLKSLVATRVQNKNVLEIFADNVYIVIIDTNEKSLE